MGLVFKIASPGLPKESMKPGYYVPPGKLKALPDFSGGVLDFLIIACDSHSGEASVYRVDETAMEELAIAPASKLSAEALDTTAPIGELFREFNPLASLQRGIKQLGFSPMPGVDGRLHLFHVDPACN